MCNQLNYSDEFPETDIEETESDDSVTNVRVIYARWIYDEATTLDEVIEKLSHEIEYIKKLKEDGWELTEAVKDDYGFIKQR